MIGLGALVVDHFDAVEADLQRFYGLDLPAILWGPEPVSFRRFAVLVRGIPAESALGISTGVYRPGWGTTEELLAILAELVDLGNRTFFKAHSKRGAQQPKALEITRPPDPSEAPKERRPATSDDIRAIFGGAVRYTGARGTDTEYPEQLVELPELGPVPDPRDVAP